MPIYEYVCAACGHQMDVLQKVSDAPIKICPVCGKNTLGKSISAPHVQFKGKGFYETDYKKQPGEKTVTKEKGTKPSESSTEKSAEKDTACQSGCSCCHCPHQDKK